MTEIKDFIKNCLFMSSIFGTYYLAVFSNFEQIPFPFDMTILPTILIALGVLSLTITVVILIYSSISIVVLADPMDINYSELFYVKPETLKHKHIGCIINYFFLFCFIPSLILTTLHFDIKTIVDHWVIALCINSLLFSYYILTPNTSIFIDKLRTCMTQRYFKTAATFIYIGFFSLFSMFIFVSYAQKYWRITSSLEYLITLVVYFLANFLIIIPTKNKQQENEPNLNFRKEKFSRKVIKSPAFIIYSAGVLLSLAPGTATRISSTSFELLNVGGGIFKSYFLSKDEKLPIPLQLIDNCELLGINNQKICVTKRLKVILDVGGVLYIKDSTLNNHESTVSLPRQNLYLFDSQNQKFDIENNKKQ